MDEELLLIPISALQHYSFCPRQCGLIHLEQCFEDNALTMRGHAAHKRVDRADGESDDGIRTEYSLPLYSDKLGLIGKADAVEFISDGSIYPVEYKHGTRAEKIHDEIQLAAQAMCLEEMTGRPIPRGCIYHFKSRRRREVEISESLRDTTTTVIQEVRLMLNSMLLPPPVNDNRCHNCSLIEICQPDIIHKIDKQKGLAKSLFGDGIQ